MRVRIHRGAHEIGGNCIEVESGNQHIVLDIGLPLSAQLGDQVPLPAVSGLVRGDDPGLLGVVLSHPHQDHYGLIPRIHDSIPVFLGRDAHALLQVAARFSSAGAVFPRAQHYGHGEPFELGPFRITPFLADHSAFDAYSMLIEANGRRLVYSGDLRAHGRKPWAPRALVKGVGRPVHALILEGTNVGRTEDHDRRTEADLENELMHDMRATEGIVLAWFAGQNLDRFVTFFRAALRAGRGFVVDPYVAHVLLALGRKSLPDPTTRALSVFLPAAMRRRIIRDHAFEIVAPFRARRIFPEKLAPRAGELVLGFRPLMIPDLERAGCLTGGRLLYSMWPGYLARDDRDIRAWCAEHGVDFSIRHVSGHAYVDDLKRLVEVLAPERIVPIHTEAADRFANMFPNVRTARDGEWWEV